MSTFRASPGQPTGPPLIPKAESDAVTLMVSSHSSPILGSSSELSRTRSSTLPKVTVFLPQPLPQDLLHPAPHPSDSSPALAVTFSSSRSPPVSPPSCSCLHISVIRRPHCPEGSGLGTGSSVGMVPYTSHPPPAPRKNSV